MSESDGRRGVIYMLYGAKHALQVVVSIWSLRSVWDGPIALMCGHDQYDETSLRLAEAISEDGRLDVLIVPFPFERPHQRRGSGYYNKTRLYLATPFVNSIFLDADTLVVGRLDELWPSTSDEVVLTQFASWSSNGTRVKSRVEGWRKVCPDLVDRMQQNSYPAINTGVFGFHVESQFMEPWKHLTSRNLSFICDELAAQLLFPDFPCRVLDHRWNASVVYSVKDERVKQDVRVWHGHGSKFFRKASGRAIWRPYYDECVRQNIAGVADWTPYKTDDDFKVAKGCRVFR